jgi:hypothetical protein
MALNGWSKKSLVTIPSSKVTGNLVGYQISLCALNVPSELLAASGGCNNNGSDIRFATDSAGNNLLDFDLQMIDKAAGEIIVNVKADVSSTTNTLIYIFWGNSSAQLPQYFVWSEYYAAIHFQELATGNGFKTAKDTAGTYNGISERGTPVQVSCMMPGQKAWNCLKDNFAVLEEEMNLSGDFYFEFLINFNGVAPTAGVQNIFAPIDYYSSVGTTGIGINYGGLVLRDTSIGGAQWSSWSTWHHVAFYRQSGRVYYYLNGVLHSNAAFTNNVQRLKWLSGASTPFLAVQYPNANFSIANLRFTRNSPVANPINVIKTRWNNYKFIATFAFSGAVETVSVQTTLTVINIPLGAELRLYEHDANPNTLGVELVGFETGVSTTFNYPYAYVSDREASLQIIMAGFEELNQLIILGATSQTVILNLIAEGN